MASLASAPPPLCSSSPSRHRRRALPAAVRCRAHFHPQLGSHRHVSLALRTRRWLFGNQVERRMEQRKLGCIERTLANGCHRVETRSSFNGNSGDISCFQRYNRHRTGRAWRFLTEKQKFPWRGHLINSQSVKDGFLLQAAAGHDEPHVATTAWANTINENPVLHFCDPETGKMDLESFLNSNLPSHPKLCRGQLKNGLRYIILPHKMPANMFETHMEIHVGSVDEEDDEQGVAHMIEHVAFLGSRKREKILSTGARSNAYTDFHHTVFHFHSPTTTENSNGDILPSVLDALNEIAFHPEFLSSRIEKERRAILSELQMMNTMEYRIDCQLLQYLHSENKLSNRFPIGLEDQIKKWDAEKIQQFHERWYFPANATLYIVGDISNVSEVIHQIKVFFENTLPENNASTVSTGSAFGAVANFLVPKLPGGLMGGLSSERTSVSINQSKATKKVRHAIRPPVIHDWCIPGLAREEKIPQIFQHKLIQNFSINMFCKGGTQLGQVGT